MTKRALLIGINYLGTSSQLFGCHNDVDLMAKKLRKLGYTEMVVMKDSLADPGQTRSLAPTKKNILKQIKRLVSVTTKGDTLFVLYSGHGSYTRDLTGDEVDGRDEYICPVDIDLGNVLTDDELRRVLVDTIHDEAKLRCLFDSCHSGTCLDLRYRWDKSPVVESNTKKKKNALLISGCADDQTSADAYIGAISRGAMTWSFLEALGKGGRTYKQVVEKMRELLTDDGYPQRPQLTADKKELFDAVVDL